MIFEKLKAFHLPLILELSLGFFFNFPKSVEKITTKIKNKKDVGLRKAIL